MSRRSGVKSFWVVTLATVMGVLITAALGQWQLGRAAQKEAHARLLQSRGNLPPLAWKDVQDMGSVGAASLYERRVVLEGHWVEGKVVFLDNRPLNGRAGYWVLSPLRSNESSESVVLVVRGWAPRQTDLRGEAPDLPAESGVVRVEGRLAAAPSKLYELGQDSAGPIRQNVDVDALAREWGLSLLPVTVWQSGSGGLPAGWSRDWPVPNEGVHKHYGYAAQWFGLCALMVVLYVWFQFVSPRRSAG